MDVPNFEIKQLDENWFEIYRNNELYCKTKDNESANHIVKLLLIYENALKDALESIGKPINDEILNTIVRPMVHNMTTQIRKNTSPEVGLEVRRKFRELENEIDQIRNAVEERVKDDLSTDRQQSEEST